MDKKYKTWFDDVYSFTQDALPPETNTAPIKVLPFGIVTAHLSKEDRNAFAQIILDNQLLKKILKKAKRFYRHLPPAQAFLEEKERLYPQIAEQFERFMPFVDTAITFGTIKGDIDIALISKNGINPTGLEIVIEKNRLMNLFPIVDWNGIYWFYSTGGLAVYDKIFRSRQVINRMSYRDIIDSIENPVENARLLYGDEEELRRMKSPFDYKRNKPKQNPKSILSFLFQN